MTSSTAPSRGQNRQFIIGHFFSQSRLKLSIHNRPFLLYFSRDLRVPWFILLRLISRLRVKPHFENLSRFIIISYLAWKKNPNSHRSDSTRTWSGSFFVRNLEFQIVWFWWRGFTIIGSGWCEPRWTESSWELLAKDTKESGVALPVQSRRRSVARLISTQFYRPQMKFKMKTLMLRGYVRFLCMVLNYFFSLKFLSC